MFTTKKIAIVTVVNDLATDHRVYKTCNALIECNYDVVLIGRLLPHSIKLPNWPFKCVRLRLFFTSGPAFYFFFNLRLFLNLLFRRADMLYANDLDTLLPNFVVSRLKRIPLVYDSHELFTEVPELLKSPIKRKIWKGLESWIVPKLKHCITVNKSIATIFEHEYGVPFSVVRNIPDFTFPSKVKSKNDLNIPSDKKIVLLQGAGINIDRGAEELVDAMKFVDNCILIIIGSGDVWPLLKDKIKMNLQPNVILIDRLPKEELVHYTCLADLGISIDKNTNLNYFYSLPNKVFDYIHAGVPILTSKLPELENIITEYKIGDFISSHDPRHIAEKISEMLNGSEIIMYKQNTLSASRELNWKNEKQILINLISSL